MMNKIASILLALAALLLAAAPTARASEGGAPWDRFPTERLTDNAALQRGAKIFVNHCLNCHSAAYMRYSRLHDIGLSDEQIKSNLLFTGGKVGDMMVSAVNPRDAKEWFGATPPDLTVVARSRAGAQGSGADYLYTYMRSFYRDASRPTGWNNTAFPNVGMPHVLWEQQGEQRAVFAEEKDAHDPAKTEHVFKGFELAKTGAMSKLDYDAYVADLVAFMQWMGEPAQDRRWRLGVWVLLFLALFTFVAWRLNAAYWKDIK